MRYPLDGSSAGDPPTLYPFENLSYLAQHPASLHYSRLLRGVAAPGVLSTDFTVLEGDIVEGLPEQPDDLTYTFTIKPNVLFHDRPPMDGRRATMEDFARTYEAFISASQNAGAYESVIDSVVALDEETLQVTLNDVFAPFLITHASSPEGVWFIPVETIANGQVQTDPVGTGPWMFREWDTGVAMRWDRHPEFHDAPAPYFDQVEMSLQGDPQRILAALEVGDFDFSNLSPNVFEEAKGRLDPTGTDLFVPEAVYSAIYFNFDSDGGRWRDKRLRQALSLALDRDGYLQTLDQTGQGDWHSHLSPALAPFYISPRDEPVFGANAKWFQHNPDESRALLRAATGEDSIDFRLTANVDAYGAAFQAQWELTAVQLKEVGFNAELTFQDYGSYIESTYLGEIAEGIAIGPLNGSPRDPNDIFSRNMESSSARHNWGGTPIEEMERLDSLFAEQRTILDIEERVEFIRDIQREMAESMLQVPYQANADYGYVQPWVLNYNHKVGYGIHRTAYAEAYFDEARRARD